MFGSRSGNRAGDAGRRAISDRQRSFPSSSYNREERYTLCTDSPSLCDAGIRHCSAAPSRKVAKVWPLLSPNRLRSRPSAERKRLAREVISYPYRRWIGSFRAVTVIKVDVIGGCSSRLQPYCLAHYKRDGLGLSLPNNSWWWSCGGRLCVTFRVPVHAQGSRTLRPSIVPTEWRSVRHSSCRARERSSR